MIAVPFINLPHTIHFVAGRLAWSKTEGSLPFSRRNCITHYHAGHGWGLHLENNWATSIRAGAHKGDENHPFLTIQAWHRSPLVRVITDPEAVQVTLFPGEEIEFFAVNLSVFQGDRIDGRMAAALHLRKRYKYHDTSRVLSTNDWRWALTDPPDPAKKNESYYREVVVPRALAAGFDNIHIDWQWNIHDDSVEPRPAFTSDAAAFADELHAQGLRVGFWFSLHGDNWGKGRDIADPANIAFKKKQLDGTLATAYRSRWQQIDLGLLDRNDEITSYSHPQDSVYRKVLGLRNYMNYATHRYPDMLMQTTCEIDNPGGLQGVGLSHLADNGIIGTYLRTESAHNVKDMFQSFGLFPLEGLLETWGEGGQKDGWQESAAWYYQFLLGRHTSIYSDPFNWTPRGIEQMRKFNDWRKNPRIQSMLNEIVRPVYEGPRDDVRGFFVGAEDENNGPFVWMFTDESKANALLLAVGGLNPDMDHIVPRLRWLDKQKSYLIVDVTLKDNGMFDYSFHGLQSGAAMNNRFDLYLSHQSSRAKALWFQAYDPGRHQVAYADHRTYRYEESWNDNRLTVTVQGKPLSESRLYIYNVHSNKLELMNVFFDKNGKGSVEFFG